MNEDKDRRAGERRQAEDRRKEGGRFPEADRRQRERREGND